MRAMRSKHRFVLLISAILLFQAISGFPLGQQTNVVSYLPTNGKQKRSHTDATPKEGAHLAVLPSVQSESISIDNVKAQELNQAEAKNERVGRAREDLEDKVKRVIEEQLGVTLEEVKNSAYFVEDLGADSLALVELIMAFEETFDIQIPDEDAEKIKTVQDAINYIRGHV